jgi:uncharacterized membrane protein YfcA
MELPVAVAAVSIPHLVATAQRFWILRRQVDRRILLSFGITSALGGLAGAFLLRQFSSDALEKVFGAVVLLGGIAELSGWMRRVRWNRAAAWIAGAVSGVLGGLVGNQGSVRTAALLGFNIPRGSFVATATAIALFVDGARVPVYLASEWDSVVALRWEILVASVAAVAGTIAGARVLRRLPEAQFRRVVAVMLLAIGVWFVIR